jgi:cytochrome c-type biogenesis protein CcmE
VKFKKSTKSFFVLVFFIALSSLITFLFSSLFKENIEFYIETDKIFEIKDINKISRLGGIIQEKSIKIFNDKKEIHFVILDKNKQNPVYIINKGLSTPPIFKENFGVIVKGKFDYNKKIFYSFEIIGKHDENYMPPTKK